MYKEHSTARNYAKDYVSRYQYGGVKSNVKTRKKRFKLSIKRKPKSLANKMDLKYHTPLRVMIKLELDNLP
jgi:hypothetical protein